MFALDVLINLNTGFYEKGTYTRDRLLILKQYLKQNLIFDLLCLFSLLSILLEK